MAFNVMDTTTLKAGNYTTLWDATSVSSVVSGRYVVPAQIRPGQGTVGTATGHRVNRPCSSAAVTGSIVSVIVLPPRQAHARRVRPESTYTVTRTDPPKMPRRGRPVSGRRSRFCR